MKQYEIIRMFVPPNKIINDNSGQTYKIKMGKMNFLANKARNILDGIDPDNLGFVPVSPEIVRKCINSSNKPTSLVFEIWKCQRTFDLFNYNTTFKPIIDVCTNYGYWEDDNWKKIFPAILSGGDYSVWNERAIRFENDGLPDDIKRKFWEEHNVPLNCIFIRVIATIM